MPTPNVSVVGLVAELVRPVTMGEVNLTLQEAAAGLLKGISAYCQLPPVSLDFNGNACSCIVDAPSTMVVGNNLAKVIA